VGFEDFYQLGPAKNRAREREGSWDYIADGSIIPTITSAKASDLIREDANS